jgi:hypothetical protein
MKEKINPNDKKIKEVASFVRGGGNIGDISPLIRDVQGAGTVALDILNEKGSSNQDVALQQYELVREMCKKGRW